jgi:flagellar biosynthesis/type III secretory pathway protein FliH
MTDAQKEVSESIQELLNHLTQLADEAEKRRKLASAKCEYYKFEFADGEKHGLDEAIKKVKAVLGKL